MKKNIRIVLPFLFIVFSSIFSFAQVSSSVISEKSLDADSPFSIQTWSTENGLPQNSINDITQTDDGYLWIATFDGIARFDGIKFTYYNTSNTPAFKTNQIKSVFVANNHYLFALSAEGDLFEYQKNNFLAVKNQPEKFIFDKGYFTYDNNSNTLFLLSQNNRIYKFSKDVFTLLTLPQKITINGLAISANNDLYIASNSGLFIYGDNQLTAIDALEKSNVEWLDKDRKGILYGYSSKGFFKLRNTICSFLHLPDSISKYTINNIGFDDANRLILLSNHGFVEITDSTNICVNTTDGLPSNNIISCFSDLQNNLWIGTSDAGLCKLKRKIAHTFLVPDDQNADDMTGITQLKNGTIMFGNFCGGLSELNSGKITHMDYCTDQVCVYSIAEDNQSTKWITSYGKGVYALNSSGVIKNYTDREGLASDIVFVAFMDKQGTVWLGTDSGLCFVDHAAIKRYDSAFTYSVKQMFEDASGRLFIASDNGFGELENNKIKWISDVSDSTLKLKNVRAIYEDADGVIWIGTYGNGLFRYKNGAFFSYLEHTNVLGINASSIVEDDKNNYWMSSNSGMYVVSKNNLNNFADNPTIPINLRYLSKEDGIRNIEFNGGFQGVALKTKNNSLLFPTVKGLVEMNLKTFSIPVSASKIIIEKISANNSNIAVKDTISLASHLNQIKVNYTIPYFNNPDKIEFQYQLVGFSKTWINVGTSREISLPNLPVGNFNLRIRTINMPVNTETDIYINHLPPFWESAYFIFGAIFSFIILLLLFSFLIIKRIEKREKKKTLLHQKYANIELKALQTQMNPHFIFNCLTAIQHFVLINDELSASKYLTKFSTLMRKYLEHSKSNHITLQEECDLLHLYIELEYLRFNGSFDYKFVIDPDLDVFSLEIPSMLFQPFVENAINHGLLNLDRKGTLTVSFKLENNCIVGIVDDDGKGRQFKKNNFHTTSEHKSRGMEIINDRIQVLNSMENRQIKLTITDKTTADGKSIGTSVRIDIPI